MGPSSDLLARIPTIAAMPILIGLLYLLQRRHPNLATRGWLLALTFIFIAQLEIFVGLLPGPYWLRFLPHLLLLIGQILAAITLACHRHSSRRADPIDLPFLILNTLPLLVFSTLYGYYVSIPWLYLATSLVAIAILLLTSLWRKENLRRALVGSLCMAIAGAFAYATHYRTAEYWLLFCVFALAIANLRTTLPAHTLGRFTMLTSLSVWAITFLFHPWLINIPHWQPFARDLWEMQKFFLCVGMLLVLLEDQVADAQWLAVHDQLTNLPNRRLLDDSLEAAIQTARNTSTRLAILFADLNGFKAINDTCGHAIGDYVLCEIGRRMQSILLPTETLARLGGDEFVVLSPHAANPNHVTQLETRLQQSIREPLAIQGRTLSVDATFGTAIYPEDTLDSDPRKIAPTLLHIADQRMYQRKSATPPLR
jgi:diguanylate cyclase